MKSLSTTLLIKIVVTVLVWCLPLISSPGSLLAWLGFPVATPIVFLRLLGVAYLALTVGYWFGFRAARQGRYPAEIVWMGIVSNGGACAVLAVGAIFQAWADWGAMAQWFMWGSLVATGALTIALVLAGPFSNRVTETELTTP